MNKVGYWKWLYEGIKSSSKHKHSIVLFCRVVILPVIIGAAIFLIPVRIMEFLNVRFSVISLFLPIITIIAVFVGLTYQIYQVKMHG